MPELYNLHPSELRRVINAGVIRALKLIEGLHNLNPSGSKSGSSSEGWERPFLYLEEWF
jgi:hypothetical protein